MYISVVFMGPGNTRCTRIIFSSLRHQTFDFMIYQFPFIICNWSQQQISIEKSTRRYVGSLFLFFELSILLNTGKILSVSLTYFECYRGTHRLMKCDTANWPKSTKQKKTALKMLSNFITVWLISLYECIAIDTVPYRNCSKLSSIMQ